MAKKKKNSANLLRPTLYDHVSSMLIALLILIGLIVGIMFSMWLTARILALPPAIPSEWDQFGDGDGEPEGGTQLDEPMADVLGMDTDIETPQLQETLASVASAVAENVATLDNPMMTDAAFTGKGGSTGDGRGKGHGSGTGTGGKGRRWELMFDEGKSLKEYAQQLDFFKIELACLLPGGKLVYATKLAQAKPNMRTGSTDKEKRYYLTWRHGGLQEADIELLTRSGADREGDLRSGIIIKFIPPETEQMLYSLEQGRAGNNAKNVRSTKFAIKKEGSGFRFYVIQQTYK